MGAEQGLLHKSSLALAVAPGAHNRPTYRSKLKQISFIPWDSIPAQQVRSSTSTRCPGLPLLSLPTCCTSLCRHPCLPPHQPVLSHEPAVPSLSQASVELRSAQTQHLCPVSHLRGMLSWLETHTPPRRSAAMARWGVGVGGYPEDLRWPLPDRSLPRRRGVRDESGGRIISPQISVSCIWEHVTFCGKETLQVRMRS